MVKSRKKIKMPDDQNNQQNDQDNQQQQQPAAPAQDDHQNLGGGRKQNIESQNIFDLLGVRGMSKEEEESFLIRLNKAIWDDFLDNDVELLLTEEEVGRLIEIINRQDADEDQKQALMYDFLKSIIPDLDEILLEKASKLKEDLTLERIASLEELASGDEGKLGELRRVRDLIREGQWADAGDLLNSVSSL